MAVFLPDAEEITIADIHPKGRLRDSVALLDNLAAMNERYEADGYLFFRNILPLEAIDSARRAMMAPLLAKGLITEDGRWVGGESPTFHEESSAFAGIWKSLFEYPGVREVLDKLLGEPTKPVPIVQYRAYAPSRAIGSGSVHQDGFHTPGVANYRPVWIPLIDMDEKVGGLTLAVGQHKRGFYHNMAKPPHFPVPRGVIDPESWSWIDYRRGDVLVVHPHTPHSGLPNTSDRVRFSIDSRVQSAANPSTIIGELIDFDENRATLKVDDGIRTLSIDDETFIRVSEERGRRMSREEFAQKTQRGLVVMAACDGDRATMLRRAAAG